MVGFLIWTFLIIGVIGLGITVNYPPVMNREAIANFLRPSEDIEIGKLDNPVPSLPLKSRCIWFRILGPLSEAESVKRGGRNFSAQLLPHLRIRGTLLKVSKARSDFLSYRIASIHEYQVDGIAFFLASRTWSFHNTRDVFNRQLCRLCVLKTSKLIHRLSVARDQRPLCVVSDSLILSHHIFRSLSDFISSVRHIGHFPGLRFGCYRQVMCISPAFFDFFQCPSAYFGLPSDGNAGTSRHENSNTSQNNDQNFKAGQWFAYPLFFVVIGSAGVFFGVYFTYIHCCDWQLLLGLLSIAIGLCFFIYGLNVVFVHMLFGVVLI